jgi:hypothetical protein
VILKREDRQDGLGDPPVKPCHDLGLATFKLALRLDAQRTLGRERLAARVPDRGTLAAAAMTEMPTRVPPFRRTRTPESAVEWCPIYEVLRTSTTYRASGVT